MLLNELDVGVRINKINNLAVLSNLSLSRRLRLAVNERILADWCCLRDHTKIIVIVDIKIAVDLFVVIINNMKTRLFKHRCVGLRRR